METSWAFERIRVPRDVGWLLLYLLTYALAGAGGYYGWLHRNPAAWVVAHDPSMLYDSTNCPAPVPGGLSESMQPAGEDYVEFFQMAGKWILLSVGLVFGVAVGYIKLFQRFPSTMTYTSAFGPALIWIAYGCFMASPASAQLSPAWLPYAFIGMGAAYVLVTLFWRSQLSLVARLLRHSARCTMATPTLVPFSVGIHFMQLVHLVPLVLFALMAMSNGRIGPDPLVDNMGDDGVCYTTVESDDDTVTEVQVPCCMWLTDRWTYPFFMFLFLPFIWTVSLFSEIRLYTIAGSVTQWYFLTEAPMRTLRSLSHAVTSSLGSLCCSSAIISACKILRSLAESDPHDDDNLVFFVLRYVARLIVWLLTEFIMAVTEFATIQMSATGDSFWPSAVSVTRMLKDQFLDAAGVWLFPQRILGFAVFMLSMVWGGANFFFARLRLEAMGREYAGKEALIFGCITGVACMIILGVVAGVLADVCKTMYICYARDLAHGQQSHADIHAIFKAIPNSKGVLVVQPDQAVAFGAGEDAMAPSAGNSSAAAGTASVTQDIESGAEERQPLLPKA